MRGQGSGPATSDACEPREPADPTNTFRQPQIREARTWDPVTPFEVAVGEGEGVTLIQGSGDQAKSVATAKSLRTLVLALAEAGETAPENIPELELDLERQRRIERARANNPRTIG